MFVVLQSFGIFLFSQDLANIGRPYSSPECSFKSNWK